MLDKTSYKRYSAVEALNHPWFADGEPGTFPLTMYERKLMDRSRENISKALRMLLTNQQLINQFNTLSKAKENKKKELSKTQKKKLVSSRNKDFYLYSSQNNMIKTSQNFKRLMVSTNNEDMAKSMTVSNRNSAKKIN